jgi:hypothetical protein
MGASTNGTQSVKCLHSTCCGEVSIGSTTYFDTVNLARTNVTRNIAGNFHQLS